jgi:DNA-binding GntR family transcriptional regulator
MNRPTIPHQLSSRYRDDDNVGRLKAVIRRIVSEANDQPSLVVEIASTIGAEILFGVRVPGSELNSVDVSRQLGASRTPVRVALQILEQEGLVEMPPRRRPRVAVLSVTDVKELYSVRAAIAAIVAAEAAVRASDDELEQLSDFVGEVEHAMATDDNEAYYWTNMRFHERMSDMAHNATLSRILDTLVLRSLLLKRIALTYPGRTKRSAHDHISMIQALQDRDGNLAAALAKSNVMGAYKVLEILLSDPISSGQLSSGQLSNDQASRGKVLPPAAAPRRKPRSTG